MAGKLKILLDIAAEKKMAQHVSEWFNGKVGRQTAEKATLK